MTSEQQNLDFSKYLLGETRGKISFDSRDNNRLAALRMASQAKLTIRISSYDLDAAIYDNTEFYAALKDLCLSSRHAHIYILINNADRVVKNGHRLVSLRQRLTSFIDIRVQGKRFKEYNEALLIADECGYIRRLQAERYEAEADFYAPRETREWIKQFEEMWAESDTDPNLGRLHI